eukprot:TRINITY_DN101987_c0_g1_i1.p1 TRINITY_DN101987_c0_g1~~TRINITY_DN101987_c0_g1_i1.p1  ORF type:complete len:286 (+),score=49.80 TRINITY_DN101987_c0_g1_i1:61-918(+)
MASRGREGVSTLRQPHKWPRRVALAAALCAAAPSLHTLRCTALTLLSRGDAAAAAVHSRPGCYVAARGVRDVRKLRRSIAAAQGRNADAGSVSASSATRAVLLVPGADDAVAAFTRNHPAVMAKAEPNFMGTPCAESDLRERFQLLGALVGREDALPLVQREPLLLAMEANNLRRSWEALLQVAAGDRQAALEVARKHPNCLIADADDMRGKTLEEFKRTADMMNSARPYTDALREIGPEGIAAGAVALGAAALGAAFAKKGSKGTPVEEKKRREMPGNESPPRG